jgi:UDP-N-acetylmuramoyl-L-alanyl-D-glutamate--2,6-diaminopimelate ligase
VRAENVELAMNGTKFTVTHDTTVTQIASPLIGRFNVSNTLAAFATGLALGIPRERMVKAIAEMKAPRGRFETYASPRGWSAVIDYAHTPDALAKALAAVKDIMKNRGGRIITLFGCGGNRDRTKRPKMGAIAAEQSDLTIVTSDNPRHEDPLAIMKEIMAGIPQGANVEQEADRGKAIARALSGARKDDVVLIAGKGHEEYQVVGDERIHFSDREAVEEFIRSHA